VDRGLIVNPHRSSFVRLIKGTSPPSIHSALCCFPYWPSTLAVSLSRFLSHEPCFNHHGTTPITRSHLRLVARGPNQSHSRHQICLEPPPTRKRPAIIRPTTLGRGFNQRDVHGMDSAQSRPFIPNSRYHWNSRPYLCTRRRVVR
jgi:hypothetical protein